MIEPKNFVGWLRANCVEIRKLLQLLAKLMEQ